MLFNQRVILSDNGVLTDISQDINDFRTGSVTVPLVLGEDSIYIGSFLPFNHRYFDVGTVNSQSAGVQVEIWDGEVFNSAIDILDQTRVAAVSLAQDGYIRWASDRNKVWVRELDSFDVTGLESTNISNFFWLRLSWTASLLAGTTLKFIGHKFSKDSYLFSFYPDLNNTTIMGAFASGKTDWEEQHFIAAEQIIRDLVRKNLIYTGDQLLDYELFLEPACHKVAELIYAGLGQTYEDKRKAAESKYLLTLDIGYIRIDENGDGNLDLKERITRTGFLTR